MSAILSFSASQDGDQKSPKKKHKHRSDSEVSAGVGITLRPQTFCLSTVKTCMRPVVFPIGFEAGVNKYDVYSMISTNRMLFQDEEGKSPKKKKKHKKSQDSD